MRIVLDWFNRNRLRLKVVRCSTRGRCIHCGDPVLPLGIKLDCGAYVVYLCDCGFGLDLREKYAKLAVCGHQKPYSYYRKEAIRIQKAQCGLNKILGE